MNGTKTTGGRGLPEAGPRVRAREIAVCHRFPGLERVEAGAFLVLELEHLQQLRRFARRSHDLKAAVQSASRIPVADARGTPRTGRSTWSTGQ